MYSCSYKLEEWPKRVDVHYIIKLKVKVKVNFTLEQATKAQRGIRPIALLFL